MCNYCHSLVDFAVSGCGKTWSETTGEGFTFQCLGCWKVDCLTAEIARLTDIVKGMQCGGRVIARTTNGERTTGNMTCRKMTGEKVRGDVTKRKSITKTMSGRKETGKKGTTEKAAGGKVSNQGDENGGATLNFHKGRYKDMREYLEKIDWNNTLKNKTATECWNILKSEIDCVVDKCVPLKKQGKRSKKKHLSKEAIRKIKYKQMMWKTYRHTGSEED